MTKINTSRNNSSSAASKVYDQLLDLIMNFKLKPFDLISEKVLAETLGISRTPVREALARLASVGLVDIYAQRGSVVAPLRIKALESSQFLREAVEVGLVTRAIVSPRRSELVEQLQHEISLQETLASIRDHDRFALSDELFHQYIAGAAGFSGIWDDIATARLHMNRFRSLTPPDIESLSTIIEQHRAIMQAVAALDENGAARAMQVHLRKIFPVIPELKNRFPGYFETGKSGEGKHLNRPNLNLFSQIRMS
ncbi:Transcriptional regulator, GntR family [hydrothermal vent metagenome]|uniref:Transcriptional regulator, GntR family n=1 Tax=hydrothermal vent metagenome TaxID=652676 RepID=A0A3B0U4A7_9ZZZZ